MRYKDNLGRVIKLGDLIADVGAYNGYVGIVVAFTDVSVRTVSIGFKPVTQSALCVSQWGGKKVDTNCSKTSKSAYGEPCLVVNGMFIIEDGDDEHVKVRDNSTDVVYIIEHLSYNRLNKAIAEQIPFYKS